MNTYKNYIDLLRNILKNSDNDEFNDIIKKILSKIFDEYYMNRNDKIYCLNNLYKKFYSSRCNFIKKKYGVVKNEKLIFRFNRYSKKSYIIKLLKENFCVILDENETYDKVADNIVQLIDIKNYKKYIEMFIEREIEHGIIKVRKKEVDKKFSKKVDNDFIEYSNYLTCICYGHYCPNHNNI